MPPPPQAAAAAQPRRGSRVGTVLREAAETGKGGAGGGRFGMAKESECLRTDGGGGGSAAGSGVRCGLILFPLKGGDHPAPELEVGGLFLEGQDLLLGGSQLMPCLARAKGVTKKQSCRNRRERQATCSKSSRASCFS